MLRQIEEKEHYHRINKSKEDYFFAQLMTLCGIPLKVLKDQCRKITGSSIAHFCFPNDLMLLWARVAVLTHFNSQSFYAINLFYIEQSVLHYGFISLQKQLSTVKCIDEQLTNRCNEFVVLNLSLDWLFCIAYWFDCEYKNQLLWDILFHLALCCFVIFSH